MTTRAQRIAVARYLRTAPVGPQHTCLTAIEALFHGVYCGQVVELPKGLSFMDVSRGFSGLR